MADSLTKLKGVLSCYCCILGGCCYSQSIGRTADELSKLSLAGIDHRELGNLNLLEEVSVICEVCTVPGTVLIECILALHEVILYFVIGKGYSVGIKVAGLYHALEGVNCLCNICIVPGGLSKEDVIHCVCADGLFDHGLKILGYTPGLTSCTAEGNDILCLQSIAALDQIVICGGNLVVAGFLQKVHVSEQTNNVHGQRHAVMLSVIGGVAHHNLGKLALVILISVIQAVNLTGLYEIAKECAGPGKEDIGYFVGSHSSLDLGLVGLVLKCLPVQSDVGIFLLHLLDSQLIGLAVGIALGSDTPHLQRCLLVLQIHLSGAGVGI